MTAVALFSTYAPSEGFGGPARAFHQRVVLESAGYRVVHVVIQSTPEARSRRSNDITELVERPFRGTIDHIYNDVDIGNRASRDARLIGRVVSHLRDQGTSAIILEQPFLVGVVERVAHALGVPVIYSSQNIEFKLRRDLERFQYVPERTPDRNAEVRSLEASAVSLASAVTTICRADQTAMFEEFGCESTIVPNGTSVVTHLDDPQSGPDNRSNEPVDFAFAGSAYWPNIEGFAKIAAPSLAFLPPTTRIHVVGSVCNDLLNTPSILRHQSVNASRIRLRGFLPMADLIRTMREARCVLVPVFIGEGSNLKSADALGAGVAVIMTQRATHGYEDILSADSEGVTVVESAAEFRAAMSVALRVPRPIHPLGRGRRGQLSWPVRLQPLVDVVRSLTNVIPGDRTTAAAQVGNPRANEPPLQD
jgi:hypothetical protein